ncbi:MAG TPA: hypothetical protein VI685_15430 [Candidatus Angelobacter sp.]
METKSCNNGSGAGFSPTAGAEVAGAAADDSEAAPLFAGALAFFSEANAAKGRNNTIRIPASIRCEVETISVPSLLEKNFLHPISGRGLPSKGTLAPG